MGYQVIPFCVEHLVSYPEVVGLLANHPDTYARLKQEVLTCPAFTLVWEGELVGSAGIMKIMPHVGEAWLMVNGKLPEDQAFRGVRLLRAWLDRLQAELDLARVQCVVMPTPEAVRLTKLLGFEPEGTLRRYGLNGEDCFMASRIRS